MIVIPSDVYEKTRELQEKILKLKALFKPMLPNWEMAHESICFVDNHKGCKVSDELVKEMNMILKESDRLNIEIIELQRPYAEHDDNWLQSSQKLLDAYANWKDKYNNEGM